MSILDVYIGEKEGDEETRILNKYNLCNKNE
jgi:hypothetical protein